MQSFFRWVLALVAGYMPKWILDQFVLWTWLVPLYIISIILSLVWYVAAPQCADTPIPSLV